ncbi:MAG: glycosyltransferase family 4 protein [Hyphomicrobiaceae bacterium]
MPGPTILQIIPELDTGGAEISTLEIVEALTAAGAKALVATEGGRLAGEVERLGGELVPFPAATKNPVKMWANAGKLARLVRQRGIALLHARSRAPAWSALVAARRTNVPFVTTYHGAYGGQSRLKNAYNGVMARADLVIANSGFTARLVMGRHGTPASCIRIIHRGVDLRKFDPAEVAPDRVAELRRAWGVGPDQPVFLQAARLAGWKGHRTVIDAFGQLNRNSELRNAVVVMAGDPQGRDGYRDELLARIRTFDLGERIRLTGHCADMPAAFAAARLAIVASTEPEAFGRAVTEASSMGVPVIATDIGAPPETVVTEPETDRTGWLVSPGDAGALADALRKATALTDPERAAFAHRARRHVARRFSVGAMQHATLAVYDELLGTDLAQSFGAHNSSPQFAVQPPPGP